MKKTYQRIDSELKRLQQENLRLKQLLADKALALMIKEELFKKNNPNRQEKLLTARHFIELGRPIV